MGYVPPHERAELARRARHQTATEQQRQRDDRLARIRDAIKSRSPGGLRWVYLDILRPVDANSWGYILGPKKEKAHDVRFRDLYDIYYPRKPGAETVRPVGVKIGWVIGGAIELRWEDRESGPQVAYETGAISEDLTVYNRVYTAKHAENTYGVLTTDATTLGQLPPASLERIDASIQGSMR